MSEDGAVLGLPNPMRLSWQSSSSASMEDMSDFRILPDCKGLPCTGKLCTGSLSSDGQDESMPKKHHIYKELDQSTMEPHQEYTKLIVTEN